MMFYIAIAIPGVCAVVFLLKAAWEIYTYLKEAREDRNND